MVVISNNNNNPDNNSRQTQKPQPMISEGSINDFYSNEENANKSLDKRVNSNPAHNLIATTNIIIID